MAGRNTIEREKDLEKKADGSEISLKINVEGPISHYFNRVLS